MKICENCKKENNGLYGSGRFCNKKCACCFSTKEKRKEINQKVSESLKGRLSNGFGFEIGYDPRRRKFSDEDRKKAIISVKKYKESLPFESLCISAKRSRVIKKQGGKCFLCGISEWMGVKLSLQMDHIDGNRQNNDQQNLRALCPNCHSITPTYCSKNKYYINKQKVSDADLIQALKDTDGVIYKALEKVGLNKKCHYRAKKLSQLKDM